MEHKEGHFKSRKGQQVYQQSWSPVGDIRAVIVLVHGLGEHSGALSESGE